VEDWYEFNDASVSPIRPGVLQSKFGGSGKGGGSGTAYMLIYRQRKANVSPKVQPTMPKWQAERIDELNKSQAAARLLYQDLKNQIDIIIQPLEEIFDIEYKAFNESNLPDQNTNDDHLPLLKYKNETDLEK